VCVIEESHRGADRSPSSCARKDELRPGYYSRVRIVRHGGDADEMVKPGEAGELIVDASAETFFSGYLNRPDATAEKLRNGWYFTGDVCVMHENGDMDLVGLVDDVIRSGGESVYPEEVEALLASHPSVREAAVLGVPDPLWGEMVVACVVLNGSGAGWQALDTHCRSSALARYKRPRAYLTMESLPRNAANKVLRQALREMASKAREAGKADKFYLVEG
jgi:2-furoate---CoA ligase